MKILQIITKTEFGGAQSVLVSLANKLAEQHEVVVAGGEGNGEMWKMLAPGIKQVKLKHLKRSVSLKDDFLAFIEFKRIIKFIYIIWLSPSLYHSNFNIWLADIFA